MSTLAEVEKKFSELFKNIPLKVRAPGRVNLLGEHMDYNLGISMCAAIDKEIYFATALNNSASHCRIYALDCNEFFEFELNSLAPVEKHWSNYLTGVVAELLKLNKELKGFDCVFGGNLPQGAGLSSSAAMTCGLAFSLNKLFQFQLAKTLLAKLCMYAENNFANVKCGLLDPLSSFLGIQNKAMILNFKTLDYDYIDLPLNDYAVLLFNTNVNHNLAKSGHLNERFESCMRGVGAIKKINASVNSLCDASADELQMVKSTLTQTDYNRCNYIIREMERFHIGKKYLSENKIADYGQTLFETHEGMKNLYRISCRELDILVDHAKGHKAVLGARMMGGGYGGCTLNIIDKHAMAEIKSEFQKYYHEQTGKHLSVYEIKIVDGVSVVN